MPESDADKCAVCDMPDGGMDDPLAAFWDPTLPGEDKQVLAHGECGSAQGWGLA